MKRKIILVIVVICIVLLALFYLKKSNQNPITITAHALAKQQVESGLFNYEIDLYDLSNSSENNIVRQAGTAFSLAEYLVKNPNDKYIANSLKSTLKAFQNETIPYKNGYVLTLNNNLSQAESGATALAILSEILYSKATNDQTFQDLTKKWKDGIVALYLGNEYDFDKMEYSNGFSRLPGSKVESDFSNGEIWLALAYYHEAYPDDENITNILSKIDDYFLSKYANENMTIGFYHWGAMASLKRYQQTKDTKFAKFSADSSNYYISKINPRLNDNTNSCYAIEGLISGYQASEYLNSSNELLEKRIISEHRNNMEYRVEIDMSPYILADKDIQYRNRKEYTGLFLNGFNQTQSRIDYTQHCLSAMLKYNQVFENQSE